MKTTSISSTVLTTNWLSERNPISLYAHIPFCQTRCSYCAFNTYTGLENLIEPFVAALRREMELVSQAAADYVGAAHTLYFGGGTPSLLDASQIASIIETARRCYDLDPKAEITLEVNPGTATLEKLRAFRAAGVNRMSIGVQSSHESDLILFARKHTFEDAAEAFRLARAAGMSNINVDLIYGAPYQSREGWQETLRTVLAWQPDHVSLYSLTLEPQTLLERQVASGQVPTPDSDLAADMYDDAKEYAARAGLVQYEISNWARPGCESAHNRQYWLNQPFLGFGPGAHGGVSGVRYWNVKPVHDYINKVASGQLKEFPYSPALAEFDVIDREMEMAETMILGLRLVQEGIDRAAFQQRFGQSPEEAYPTEIEKLIQQGLLFSTSTTLQLTERAYLISNRVFVQFYPD